MQVALGEPLLIDESDRYLPPADIPWDELRRCFLETRRETLGLVRRLEEANVGRDVTVPHNQWGDLTVYGWLNYLKGHAHRDLRAVG